MKNAAWTFNSDCDAAFKKQKLFALATCEIEKIYNPYTGSEIRKDEFGFIVVCFDLLVCIAFFAFIYCLSNRQKRYVNQFRDQTIEMNDFSMSIGNLPLDLNYGDKEEVLRAHLTHHFESLLKDQLLKIGYEEKDLNNEEHVKKWQVSDVCFGNSSNSQFKYLEKMANLRNDFTKEKKFKAP
jgi:hypothetical protein